MTATYSSEFTAHSFDQIQIVVVKCLLSNNITRGAKAAIDSKRSSLNRSRGLAYTAVVFNLILSTSIDYSPEISTANNTR